MLRGHRPGRWRKGEEADSPGARMGAGPCGHPAFGPVSPVSDFQNHSGSAEWFARQVCGRAWRPQEERQDRGVKSGRRGPPAPLQGAGQSWVFLSSCDLGRRGKEGKVAGVEWGGDGAPAQLQERGWRRKQGPQPAAGQVWGLFMGFYGSCKLTLGCKGEGLQPLSEAQAAPEADAEGE